MSSQQKETSSSLFPHGVHLYSYSITRTVTLLLQYPRFWLLHYRIPLPLFQSLYASVGACVWMNKLDASVKVVVILKEKNKNK